MTLKNPWEISTNDPLAGMQGNNESSISQFNPSFETSIVPRPPDHDPFRDTAGNGIPDAYDHGINDINNNGIPDNQDLFLTQEDISKYFSGS